MSASNLVICKMIQNRQSNEQKIKDTLIKLDPTLSEETINKIINIINNKKKKNKQCCSIQ